MVSEAVICLTRGVLPSTAFFFFSFSSCTQAKLVGVSPRLRTELSAKSVKHSFVSGSF